MSFALNSELPPLQLRNFKSIMAAKTATIIPLKPARGNVKVKKAFVHRSITQQARRLQSVDYIGEGESLVQTCKRTFNFGRRIPVQPECMVVVYDITFFATFFIGNAVTLIWNPKFMSDNPIMNYFRNNNICVGIDSYPARFVTVPHNIWTVNSHLHICSQHVRACAMCGLVHFFYLLFFFSIFISCLIFSLQVCRNPDSVPFCCIFLSSLLFIF